MSINHRFFELTWAHIALIKQLDTKPESLALLGSTLSTISPFIDGKDLDHDLGMILVGKELSDEEKETLKENNTPFLTRDNMDALYKFYEELPTALSVVFNTGKFEEGVYYTRHYEVNWKKYNG